MCMPRVVTAISALFLVAAPLGACFCISTGDPCSAMAGNTVVFLGSVLVDSGDKWGSRPARVRVEEPLFNVPEGMAEVEIDTSAGTSCYYRLRAGEIYVIFAGYRGRARRRLVMTACSDTFLLAGNEHILEALRNQSQGGRSRLVGTVRRSSGEYSMEGRVAGALVTARSATAQYQGISNAFGGYEIRGIAPDRYEIEVSKPGFVPNAEYNRRWSGRLVVNEATDRIEPDETEPAGSVLITERSCVVWDLSMWPHGRISGVITNAEGKPLAGVTVQAFAFDAKGEREPSPLRTARTDSEGRYTIEPLPGGDYVVGVNAEKYSDDDPYPPTVFTREKGSSAAVRVPVSDGLEAKGIDLVLPARRIATVLCVEIIGPKGAPYKGALVSLENLAGVQRWYSVKRKSDDLGKLEVPAYIGEQYIVKASDFSFVPRREEPKYDYLGGSARVDVTGEHPSVLIVLAPRLFSEGR